MPAILLFHRRTILGGDDLQPVAFVTMCGRIFQLLFLCLPVMRNVFNETDHCGLFDWSFYDPNMEAGCRHGHFYCLFVTLWINVTFLYVISSFVLEARIAYWSCQGSPTEHEPRSSNVRQLLQHKLLPFSVVLFFIWITGIVALCFAPMYYRCKEDDATIDFVSTTASGRSLSRVDSTVDIPFYRRVQWWWAAAVVLLISQIAEVFACWAFLLRLYTQPFTIDTSAMAELPSLVDDADVTYLNYNHELVEDMWAERCATSCHFLSAISCYMFGGRNVATAGPSDFGDVARALADFMESRGVLNIVPSDVVTGMIVLQRLQRQRVYAARLQVLDEFATINATDSGIVSDGDVVLPKKHKETANIRRRTNSGINLVGQEDGLMGPADLSRPASEDHLLLPLEAGVRPGVAPGRSVGHIKQHRHHYRMDQDGSYLEEERELLNRSDDSEMFLLNEAERYAKYALAIYTWVLYLYVHPITGPVRLIVKNKCACCCLSGRRAEWQQFSPRLSTLLPDFVDENGRIVGDNLCQTHKNAILLTAGLEESEIVYVQLKSSFSDVPYCILIDHGWKSVVVSIRGTFSLEDCVTDVLIQPESLEQLGKDFDFDASGQHCHGGVMACARNIYRDLERHGLLDELLIGNDARFPDYTLRFVGHSLGAATSTLMSYMLRSKFPTLRCVNYSPPGCTFTWDMATRCNDWCTSCVLDSDLVPRLSVDSIEHLRDEILDLIGRIKVPKIEVARRFVSSTARWGFQLFQKQDLEDKEALMRSMSEILYEPDEVPDSEYQQQLARFKEIQDERRRQRGMTREIQLYPPGRILHLAKTGETRSCTAGLAKILTCCTSNIGSQYVPVWIDNGDLNEIVVSSTMATDHFPNRIRHILEGVASNFGQA